MEAVSFKYVSQKYTLKAQIFYEMQIHCAVYVYSNNCLREHLQMLMTEIRNNVFANGLLWSVTTCSNFCSFRCMFYITWSTVVSLLVKVVDIYWLEMFLLFGTFSPQMHLKLQKKQEARFLSLLLQLESVS